MNAEFITGFPVSCDSPALHITQAAPVFIAIPTECHDCYSHAIFSLLLALFPIFFELPNQRLQITDTSRSIAIQRAFES